MAESVTFSAELDPDVLERLSDFASTADRTVASVLNEAVEQYLQRACVRPAFREATEQVLDRNAELLVRLAK